MTLVRSWCVAPVDGIAMARSRAMGILIRLVITAVALWIANLVIDGIRLTTDSVPSKIGTLLAVAVIFGIVNAVLRPIIKTVGCGLYVLTLGLISLIVNGLLFLLTSWIAGELNLPFHVDNFWPSAVFGALLVGIVSWVLNALVPDRDDD
jgi:putative membrane protein